MDELIRQAAETGTKSRPTLYNRRWHLDEDQRRHHGARQWDARVIEEIIALAAASTGLYPPDFSDRDAVLFRAVGTRKIVAEIRTDSATEIVLRLGDATWALRAPADIPRAALAAAFASSIAPR